MTVSLCSLDTVDFIILSLILLHSCVQNGGTWDRGAEGHSPEGSRKWVESAANLDPGLLTPLWFPLAAKDKRS